MDAVGLVASLPGRCDAGLGDARGTEQHPELGWSVTGYVAHVGDNLRIWAERVAGILAGAPSEVAPYDQDALAAARRYDRLALPAARWSLERAAADWVTVLRRAQPLGVVLHHPDRGPMGIEDVARVNAHDAVHHLWDIDRILGARGNDGPSGPA